MIFKLGTLMSLVIFMMGCEDSGTNIAKFNGEGIFKVDTLSYNIGEGIASNDSLWNYVEYNLSFHFENYSGTLNSIVFVFDDSIGRGLNLDYAYPESANKIFSWKEKLWLQKRLNNNDSVKISCGMSGAFWERVNNNFISVDTFNWQRENTIYYNR
ncbi:MAG TPA: hypothetical protein DHV28_12060 [Ignavibacteriales bacterium]|nr:hypothetical protein [Ignavibacteriales bacterium]